jgi:MoaA/NifB/PqqE/SkfB family radical SAM enzyme
MLQVEAGENRVRFQDRQRALRGLPRTSAAAISAAPCARSATGTRAADLTLAAFQRLIDEQIGIVEIKLQGSGEPTMQRYDYFAMIRYARERHIWARTTTNASLLHLKDNYRKMIDADVNELQISVDGASKRVYEGIRRGANYERVMANIALFNRYARE